MARVPTVPVQVRLPEPVSELLTRLAAERGESKTQIVVEALELLGDHLLEQKLEEAYRDLGDSQLEIVRAMQPLIAEAIAKSEGLG